MSVNSGAAKLERDRRIDRRRSCASTASASPRSSRASTPPTSAPTASSARRDSCTSTRRTSTPKGSPTTLTVNGKTTRKRIGKRDQFAPELLYFSDCILKDREPEPSGEEGLQDVRIVAGALPVGQDRSLGKNSDDQKGQGPDLTTEVDAARGTQSRSW